MDNELSMLTELQNVGFTRVQSHLSVPLDVKESQFVVADFVAWETRDGNSLEPLCVVLHDVDGKIQQGDLLSRLISLRDALGSTKHYVISSDGQWSVPNSEFTELVPIRRPDHSQEGADSLEVVHPELIKLVLTEELRREDGRVGSGQLLGDLSLESAIDRIVAAAEHGVEIATGALNISTIATFELIPELLENAKVNPQHFTPKAFAEALAALAGTKVSGDFFDPFFGFGMTTSAVMRSVEGVEPRSITGCEQNSAVFEYAKQLGKLGNSSMMLKLEDGLNSKFENEFDLVVTVPPWGSKVNESLRLLDDSMSSDIELSAIDLGLRALNPNGRLVIMLPVTFTHLKKSETYRDYLARNHRVAALISLPARSFSGVVVGLVILVVDKDSHGETFVAKLGDDWQEHVRPGSAFLREALEHIDGGNVE